MRTEAENGTDAENGGQPAPATPDRVRRSGALPGRQSGPVDVLVGGRTRRSRSAAGGRHRRLDSPAGGGRDRRRQRERGRLLVICGWATGLGAVALASGARGLVLVLAGTAPQWYQPTVAALGIGGIALGGVALHGSARPTLRWAALGLANLAVGVNAGLTASLP